MHLVSNIIATALFTVIGLGSTTHTTEAAPATQICEMTQILSQRDSGQQILAMAMQPSTTGAKLVFVAPFGLALSQGLCVNIDDNPLLETLFHTCLPTGCVAKTDISLTFVDALAAGENATIIMVGASNAQEISITISLAGFTAAWNRLKDLQE